MFTKQTGLLSGLRGLIPDKAIQVLQQTYHDCKQKLFHRAPVQLSIDGAKEGVPERRYDATIENVYPTLQVYNHSSFAENPDANEMFPVHNGFAADFKGVVRFTQGDPRGAGVNNVANIVMVANGGIWAQQVWVNVLVDWNGDPWQGQQAMIRFTLTGNLSSGSATCTVTQYSGPTSQDPGSTATVFDIDSIFTRGLTGCKGRAEYNYAAGQWEVVYCQQAAFELNVVLGDFCGQQTPDTVPVTDVTVASPAPFDFLPTVTEVYNAMSFGNTLNPARGRAFWNKELDAYELIQFQEVSVLAVTGFIFNADSLVYTTANITGHLCATGGQSPLDTTTC
jgi:hypothetical protein